MTAPILPMTRAIASHIKRRLDRGEIDFRAAVNELRERTGLGVIEAMRAITGEAK